MSAFPPSAAIVKAVRQIDLSFRGKPVEILAGSLDPRDGPSLPRHFLRTHHVVKYDNMMSIGNFGPNQAITQGGFGDGEVSGTDSLTPLQLSVRCSVSLLSMCLKFGGQMGRTP